MCQPYVVIDADNAGLFGPFDTLREAHGCADEIARYEIVNSAGELVDWTTDRPRPLPIAPAQD